MKRQTRLEARFHLDNANIPAVVELPELSNMPKVAEIIRACTIMRRDKRIPSCQNLLTQLQKSAEVYGIKLE